MSEHWVNGTDASANGAFPMQTNRSQELALPFQARPVFVIVGMHRSGASVLAKMLQLLGVDMAETEPDDARASWERPEIVAFNDRLLATIGRPLDSAVHALPFPPGWWGDPRVLALKREVQAYLRETLEGRYGVWGFKDLRVTRLLPFWQQVFDEMGLRPVYLWAVRDPAECASSAVASGLVVNAQIAEAMWFIYNADAHKFVGDEAVAVIDYTAWAAEPTRVVDSLLSRLPLNWRGSQADLLDCVRAITADRPVARSAPIQSPLVQTFYQAITDPDRSEQSLKYRSSVAQAVDILRTLVAPYAALVGSAAPEPIAVAAPVEPAPVAAPHVPAEPDPELQQALEAALARAHDAEATVRQTEEVLTREIEARVSENSWLQQQYLEQKRTLAASEEQLRRSADEIGAENARLKAELEALTADSRAGRRKVDDLHASAERQRKLAKEELEQVRKELALQKTANEKYLSRIYELKAIRNSADGSGAGSAAQTA